MIFLVERHLKTQQYLQIISHCTVGNDSTICFWEDKWSEEILANSHPRLASFAKSDSISVLEVMQANTLEDIFFLPLSQQALNELEHIQGIIQNVSYDKNGRDT